MSARGSSLAEYVAVVAAVGLLMLALVVVRPHHPARRPPVDPVARLRALVHEPAPPRVRRARPATAAPTRPRRPRPPAPPRPTVLVPGWAVGW
jgi:hypothetical protein